MVIEGAEEGAVQKALCPAAWHFCQREAGQEVWGLHMAGVGRNKHPQGQGHSYLGTKRPNVGFFSA